MGAGLEQCLQQGCWHLIGQYLNPNSFTYLLPVIIWAEDLFMSQCFIHLERYQVAGLEKPYLVGNLSVDVVMISPD